MSAAIGVVFIQRKTMNSWEMKRDTGARVERSCIMVIPSGWLGLSVTWSWSIGRFSLTCERPLSILIKPDWTFRSNSLESSPITNRRIIDWRGYAFLLWGDGQHHSPQWLSEWKRRSNYPTPTYPTLSACTVDECECECDHPIRCIEQLRDLGLAFGRNETVNAIAIINKYIFRIKLI